MMALRVSGHLRRLYWDWDWDWHCYWWQAGTLCTRGAIVDTYSRVDIRNTYTANTHRHTYTIKASLDIGARTKKSHTFGRTNDLLSSTLSSSFGIEYHHAHNVACMSQAAGVHYGVHCINTQRVYISLSLSIHTYLGRANCVHKCQVLLSFLNATSERMSAYDGVYDLETEHQRRVSVCKVLPTDNND